MKIRELSSQGFPDSILEIWEKGESEDLLPVQAEAIDHGLLDGKNLIIAAPTSSGKTFAAEIAAFKCAYAGRKAIYLAPHKAMVEEKYLDFTDKYAAYGIRVVVSSGDYHEFDDQIRKGEFDLAIFTYEKLAMLLVTNRQIASTCGLLIVDEIQMLSDPNRGAGLELLLTKLRFLTNNLQIVALSASVDSLNQLDRWLDAIPVLLRDRPIELREGVYTPDGHFHYRTWNSRWDDNEVLPSSPATDPDTMLATLVAHLTVQGDQLLVFRMDRRSTIETAQRLASALSLPPVTAAIDALGELENTTSRDQLVDCLRKGVAYHNADLVMEERRLVEQHFRQGYIRVICSTSTLAMGVNLPARTVIIADPQKWGTDPITDRARRVPLEVGEYRNASGRAGRYRFKDEFGRSILLATSQFEAERLFETYVRGTAEQIRPALRDRPLALQVLDIVASRLVSRENEVARILLCTFHGFVTWTKPDTKEDIQGLIRKAIQTCVDQGLLQRSASGELGATDLGRVCASKTIGFATCQLLCDWLSQSRPRNDFEALYHTAQVPELQKTTFQMATDEFKDGRYLEMVDADHDSLNIPSDLVDRLTSQSPTQLGYEATKRLKMALLAARWIRGQPTRTIEKQFNVRAGAIGSMSDTLAWILDSSAALAACLGRPAEQTDALSSLAEQLRFGLPAQILPVARLRVRGLTRDHLMRLLEHGYGTPDKILDAGLPEFHGVIPNKTAERLQQQIQKSITDTLARQRRGQLLRLQKLSLDTTLLTALYEHTGTQLEYTLCDLFTPPFCHLSFERVTRQRDGDPDNLLHLADGRLIAFSVTAKEKETSLVSMTKAGQIIPGAAPYKPVACVVIGRPAFHEQAISNAVAIAANGINYKLLPMPLLAEMYVRVREGRLSSDNVVDILRDELGHLTEETLQKLGPAA